MTVQEPDEPVQPSPRVWRIARGWDVIAADGEKLGTVAEVHRHELLVANGLLFPSELRIPVAGIVRIEHGRIRLSLERPAIVGQSATEPPLARATPEPVDTGPADREPAQETAILRPEDVGSVGWTGADTLVRDGDVLELRQERLVPRKAWRDAGEIRVRTEVEQVPGRLEVDAFREEVEVERVPVGEVVAERVAPWEDEDVLVVPVYKEELVVTRRLVLTEELRIRRVRTSQRQVFEELLRRERAVVEDPEGTQLVRERRVVPEESARGANPDDGSLGSLVRRMFQ